MKSHTQNIHPGLKLQEKVTIPTNQTTISFSVKRDATAENNVSDTKKMKKDKVDEALTLDESREEIPKETHREDDPNVKYEKKDIIKEIICSRYMVLEAIQDF